MIDLISQAYAETGATAAQHPQGGGMSMLIFLGVFFAIFYLLFIRPQSKRAKEHRQMLEKLTKGDEVVTSGGMAGKVSEVADGFVELEIAKGLSVSIQKPAIAGSLPKGTLKNL